MRLTFPSRIVFYFTSCRLINRAVRYLHLWRTEPAFNSHVGYTNPHEAVSWKRVPSFSFEYCAAFTKTKGKTVQCHQLCTLKKSVKKKTWVPTIKLLYVANASHLLPTRSSRVFIFFYFSFAIRMVGRIIKNKTSLKDGLWRVLL